MPLIQVRVIKDVFSKDQKRQIIKKLTDAMVSIEGENMRGSDVGDGRGSRERRLGHRRQCSDDERCAGIGRGQGGLTSRMVFPESERGEPYARRSRERIVCGRLGMWQARRHAALRLASISLRLTRHSAI